MTSVFSNYILYFRQFPAGENIQIAGDIAGRWHLLTFLKACTLLFVLVEVSPVP